MKKIYLSSLFITAFFSAAFSQGVSGGIRAGMNIANQTASLGSVSASIGSKIGLMVGGYVTIMTSEKFGIQPELVYSGLGSSLSSGGQTSTGSFNYLSVPVFLRYNVSENFNIQAGPQLGILLSASSTTGSAASVDIKDTVNGTDFGAAFGFGVDFGKFNAGARYYLGFSNTEKNSSQFQGQDTKLTNNAIQLFVGYTLFGKE
jgi:hypothetical protein